MIVNNKSLIHRNQYEPCREVLLKMLTFLQSPLIRVKCWVVICDQHLHLVSPAQWLPPLQFSKCLVDITGPQSCCPQTYMCKLSGTLCRSRFTSGVPCAYVYTGAYIQVRIYRCKLSGSLCCGRCLNWWYVCRRWSWWQEFWPLASPRLKSNLSASSISTMWMFYICQK